MSDLSGQAGDYLRLRRALGHKLDDAHRLLPRFCCLPRRHRRRDGDRRSGPWRGPAARCGSGELGVDAPDERGPRLRPPHGGR